MAGAECLLTDRQRALVQPLGVGVLALRLVHHGQVVEGEAVIGMVNTKTRLHHGLELLRFHERRGIIARIIEFIELLVDRVEVTLLRRGRRRADDHEEDRAGEHTEATPHRYRCGAEKGDEAAPPQMIEPHLPPQCSRSVPRTLPKMAYRGQGGLWPTSQRIARPTEWPLMCRFSDAGSDELSTRSGGRRSICARSVSGWCFGLCSVLENSGHSRPAPRDGSGVNDPEQT